MNIQFETSTLTPDEKIGLIAFLEALLPDEGFLPVNEQNNLTPAPSPTTEKQAIFGVPVQETPVQPGAAAEPTPINEPTTRKRRTKAEIAADEAAAAKAAAEPVKGSLNVYEAGDVEVAEKPTSTPTAVESKPITKEILTELTNGYIARHSMKEALAILKTTGCQRLSEAMAMEPAKLAELAEKLRG